MRLEHDRRNEAVLAQRRGERIGVAGAEPFDAVTDLGDPAGELVARKQGAEVAGQTVARAQRTTLPASATTMDIRRRRSTRS
jgi:hypothetical protein